MSTIDDPQTLAAGETAAIKPMHQSSSIVQRLRDALQWAGEWTNPILVKETRQALKSKQFVVTFALVLLFSWLWSIAASFFIGPRIYYTPSGSTMFMGYYIFLSFPLLVVVPFAIYQSLATERADRTYELLSITTLRPRQIVGGKMASAALQMIVYLSAVMPCLAFTYLLRGIDAPTILMIVAYLVLASLALSVLALLIATLTVQKTWQVFWTVGVTVGLVSAFFTSIPLCDEMLRFGFFAFHDPEFWIANAIFLTFYASFFVLIFQCATAQLTFASENRSSRIRITMLVQHALLIGWMGFEVFRSRENSSRPGNDILPVALTLLGVHWYVMGAFMTGESAKLSPRARRSLPQSQLGRTFLTWFNPGASTGYLFALANSASAVLITAVVLAAEILRPTNLSSEAITTFGVFGLFYMVIFLGLGKLLVQFVQKFASIPIYAAVAVHAILLMLAMIGPYALQLVMTDWRNDSYTLLQVINPIWTLLEVIDRQATSIEPAHWILLPTAAIVVLAANLRGILREMRYNKLAAPKRVTEDQRELELLQNPPSTEPTSPWG